jgi:hypothetical protein
MTSIVRTRRNPRRTPRDSVSIEFGLHAVKPVIRSLLPDTVT